MNRDENENGIEMDEETIAKKFDVEISEKDLEEDGELDKDTNVDDLPHPSNFKEADDELKYFKNAYKNLKTELDSYNENYLKSLADAENFKKRMAREKEESIKYSNEKIFKDLLPALDFLDLAIKHAEPFLENDETGNFKSFISGVQYAFDEFMKVLKNHGVTKIETEGKDFDPNYHEVVEMVKESGQPDGKILDEKRMGYTYKDRLLRPSSVSISMNK